MPGGQLAADMPEFLEVDDLGILGDLRLERRIAARAAAAGNVICPLLVLGQVEQRAGLAPGALDQILGDAVIGDDGEAEAFERATEIGGEAIGITGLIVEAEDRHLGRGRIEHESLSKQKAS